jgi:Na+/proline symporter
MGLSALALEGNPAFPTFPNRMSDADVSAGLVLPYAAVALLGSGGAVCTLLIVFMAVTSASSSEYIAVSSIFTYDIYQTYIKPDVSRIHHIQLYLMVKVTPNHELTFCLRPAVGASSICHIAVLLRTDSS